MNPVLNKIQKWIRNQNLAPGARIPSARRLADILTIGRSAMSRSITELVGQGVLIRDGNLFRVGRLPESRISIAPIHFFGEAWHDPKWAKRVTQKWGVDLVFHLTAEQEETRSGLLDLLDEGSEVSGVLVYGAACTPQLRALKAKGIPLMVLGAHTDEFSHVVLDSRPIAEIAIDHLMELGHRELAFMGRSQLDRFPYNRSEVENAYQDECRRRGLETSAERMHFIENDSASVRSGWRKIFHRDKKVTGLLCESLMLAEGFVRCARADGVRIPEELSILCVYEHLGADAAEIPITCVAEDLEESVTIATSLLLHDAIHSRHVLAAGALHSIRCAPRLHIRRSTEAHPSISRKYSDHAKSGEGLFPGDQLWAPELSKRLKQVRELNEKPFPNSGSTAQSRYETLDLSRWVNRRISRRNGWLGGMPLKHLPPGETRYHGIPIQILEEAIVLRSRFARTNGRQPLPESVHVEVKRKVSGVFILHAGAWTKFHEPIARYEFVTARASNSVDVIAYGRETWNGKKEKQRLRTSAIQDWHPTAPQFVSDRALPVIVTEKGDPLRYARYLYLYHWTNPEPNRTLNDLVITALRPDLQCTLGIVAITLELGGN